MNTKREVEMVAWSVGEVLWDVFPNGEQFGGAALNFCANLQKMGESALLLSAVGSDERGRLALQKMSEMGLATDHISIVHGHATGSAIIGKTSDGEPSFTIFRPAAFDYLKPDTTIVEEALRTGLHWLYFGTLLQTTPAIEHFITGLATTLRKETSTRCFYDMNLRVGHWDLPLVQRLSSLATILKLNENEAMTLFTMTRSGDEPFSLEGFCKRWSETYGIDVICVTLGPAGCFVYEQGEAIRVPGFEVAVCDTVGSGDAFAAAFLHGYHLGWSNMRTARFANALGALVASQAGATPPWKMNDLLTMAGLP